METPISISVTSRTLYKCSLRRVTAKTTDTDTESYGIFNSSLRDFTVFTRQSLLSFHMTKSYVRTATRSTLKVEANLTQILNFKANFHTEFEPFFKKKFMLTMVDTLRLSA